LILNQKSKGYEFDMMNFVVQNNLVNYGQSAPTLVTPFTINKQNYLLFIQDTDQRLKELEESIQDTEETK